jgi:RNase P subunit RPR2
MKLNPKLTRQQIQEKINKIFSEKPSQREIKKAKRLAMSKNIKLTKFKKNFCQKCYSIFDSSNSEVRIKKGRKIIRCQNCNYISRYKIK